MPSPSPADRCRPNVRHASPWRLAGALSRIAGKVSAPMRHGVAGGVLALLALSISPAFAVVEDGSPAADRACLAGQCEPVHARQQAAPLLRVAQADTADRAMVEEVQQRLTDLGYKPGPVDGAFGQRTATAIREFLTERGREPSTEVNAALIDELKAAEKEWAYPQGAETPQADDQSQPADASPPAEAAQAPEASQPAAAETDQAAAPSQTTSPHDFLAAIYTLPDPTLDIWSAERRDYYFTDRLLTLVEAAEAQTKKRHGMDGLDFNPIVPGQDYKLSDLSISEPTVENGQASVTVSFTNTLGGTAETHTLVYSLVGYGGSWLIDEITTDGKALSEVLKEIAGS